MPRIIKKCVQNSGYISFTVQGFFMFKISCTIKIPSAQSIASLKADGMISIIQGPKVPAKQGSHGIAIQYFSGILTK